MDLMAKSTDICHKSKIDEKLKGFAMLLVRHKRLSADFKVILKALVTLYRDPGNLNYVYDVEDGFLHTKASVSAVNWLQMQPEIEQLIQERYIAPHPDIEKLLQYPESTLGYAYASYIKKAGFDPGFYRQINIEDDISYLTLRIRQTHDIWHVVTGFKTDVLGEIGLKAFEMAQTRRNLAFVLVGGSLLGTLVKSPEVLPNLLEQITLGYKMGSIAKPLLAQKWEENWDKSLAELRDELGIQPASFF
jgi:ubiquinone biosynthesis protein COQ4